MTTKKLGRQTVALANPPTLAGHANVVGKKEGEGPLASSFDLIGSDDTFGEATWEKSESAMQKQALALALDKAGQAASAMDWLFAGDLLNQCIGSSFAARGQDIPFFGLYGACSTMGEGLALASMTLDGGFGEWAAVVVSSHFCTAERQYRTPLEYGGQRTPTAQWTVTGAGAAILAREGPGPYVTHCTLGKIADKGITDTNNMGAAMAPAAAETLLRFFARSGRRPEDYDAIYTGDLGFVGSRLLLEILQAEGLPLQNHQDCGLLLYDRARQQVKAVGSGAGCSAAVLAAHILPELAKVQLRRVLLLSTGALMSQTTFLQGESIPGIAHLVELLAPDVPV